MLMNPFDALTRRVATTRLSRRGALRQLGAGGLAAGLLGGATLAPRPAGAQATPPATPAASPPAEPAEPVAGLAANNATLFVQTMASGVLEANPAATGDAATPATAQPGAFRLTLQGHHGETIAFSDRPERRFGEVQTSRFLQVMGFTPVDPPNAALVTDLEGQADAVVLLELTAATYDSGTQTLTYEANLLHEYPNRHGSGLASLANATQTTTSAASFSTASLFIDDCPDGAITCVNRNGATEPFADPVGYCWNYGHACCAPCAGETYWVQQCNASNPDWCDESCSVQTGDGLLSCPS